MGSSICLRYVQTVQAAAFQAVKPSLVTHLAKTNPEAGECPWSTQGPALKKHSSDSQQEEAQAGASCRAGDSAQSVQRAPVNA